VCVDPSRSFPAGRVAFIDFGIVGAIPAATAEGMLDFVRSFPAGDMAGVGRALEKMGFTKELSEEQSAAFAKDIGEVIASIDSMTADIATTASAGAAASAIDETQLNRAVAAVARVAEGCRILAALAMHCIRSLWSAPLSPPRSALRYGIRFPREFALLIKQVLYFDRYTSLLAPGLDVLNDERLSMNRPPPPGDGGVSSVEGGSVAVEVLPPEDDAE